MVVKIFLVWFLFYSPSTHFRSFWVQCYHNHTVPGQAWPSLLRSLAVLGAHSFASNWQLLFLNQRKRENGCRIFFMTKSWWRNVPDMGIELRTTCMPSGHASDRATMPSCSKEKLHCKLYQYGMYWYFCFWKSIWATSYQNQQNGMCAQLRIRSALASAPSDQSLLCLHEESLGP